MEGKNPPVEKSFLHDIAPGFRIDFLRSSAFLGLHARTDFRGKRFGFRIERRGGSADGD